MTNYPETKRLTIDDWSIIPDGLMKGVYHSCTPDTTTWKQRVVTKLTNVKVCPACQLEVPKDIDAIASTMGIQ